MKPNLLVRFAVMLVTLQSAICHCTMAQGTAFTYQGRLNENDAPFTGNAEFQATLWDAASGGNAVAPNTPASVIVPVSNGLFVLSLNFSNAFPGADRWLQLDVRTTLGPFNALTPRQPLTPTPYAIHAQGANAAGITGTLPATSLSGTYSNPLALSNSGNTFNGSFIGDGSGLANVNAAAVGGVGVSNLWRTTGNAGTTAGVNFLGTTDHQGLELRVNNVRAFRLEPDPRFGNSSANLIGGYVSNRIELPGSGGSVIVGGGFAGGENIIRSNSSGAFIGGGSVNRAGPNANDVVIAGGNGNQAASFAAVIGGGLQNSIQTNSPYSTIGGGVQNILRADSATIGGGAGNTNAGYAATIAGGFYNAATNNGAAVGGGGLNVAGGFNSVVAGGNNNLATAENSAVGGGQQNTNSAYAATISGGLWNQATNYYATIPGGVQNLAGGQQSFAAGTFARALHYGAFVWGDGTYIEFPSLTNNEFAVRASGGVRFVAPNITLNGQPLLTANATTAITLTNAGNTLAGTFSGNGSSLTSLNASQLSSGTVPTAALENAWKITGNTGTTPGASFLGTTDNQPVELKVNGGRALRLEPTGSNSVNVVGGYGGNSIVAGKVGGTIAGGGAGNYLGNSFINQVGDDFGTVSGGARNAARPYASAIGGGVDNRIEEIGAYSVIGGGFTNVIGTNAQYATIGGGVNNWVQGSTFDAVIAGGGGNRIGQSAHDAAIGGGLQNRIQNGASFGAIAGGVSNTISLNVTGATIAGGDRNYIGTNSSYSAIGGGSVNNITNNSWQATIAGGTANQIWASYRSSIGGGNANVISNSWNSVISGGIQNLIADNSPQATIGGGDQNVVGPSGSYGTISGGYGNRTATNAQFATVAGGRENTAATYAFAAGRRAKANHQGAFVWADSIDADFASTTNNQFRVRAAGGLEVVGGTNAVEAFKYSGSRSGGFASPVGYAENNNTSGSSAPTLRLVGKGGNSADGVLSVSTLGTGDLARFGNSSTFVAWLTTNGTWNALAFNPTSDRAAKENFSSVDPRDVLEKVAALPLARWNYKAVPGAEHIGPVAQDFHAAFGLNGDDDKHIATVDADGVALAAIQGLNEKVESGKQKAETRLTHLEAELKRRDAENAELKAAITELRQEISMLKRRH